MKATLRRKEPTEDGVFGHLYLHDDAGKVVATFCTAEDDWRENKPRVSCIPVGTYTCRRTMYYKHGYPTFEITGVPGRSRILFHSGNTEEDVEGCVLLGKEFGSLPVNDEDDPKRTRRIKWAVVRSKVAFAEFMRALGGVDTFPLEIAWSEPGVSQAA
jgi:hypothetical protein